MAEQPEQTAKALLAALQRRYPGQYPDALLRTLQRRVRHWRTQALLVFDERWLDEDPLTAPPTLRGVASPRPVERSDSV